jgi:hypothetical protein
MYIMLVIYIFISYLLAIGRYAVHQPPIVAPGDAGSGRRICWARTWVGS